MIISNEILSFSFGQLSSLSLYLLPPPNFYLSYLLLAFAKSQFWLSFLSFSLSLFFLSLLFLIFTGFCQESIWTFFSPYFSILSFFLFCPFVSFNCLLPEFLLLFLSFEMDNIAHAMTPSIRTAQVLSRFLFALFAFFTVFDFFVEQTLASHSTAFNCKKANVSLEANLTRLLNHNYAYTLSYHEHVPIFVYLAQLLKTNEVVYAHDLTKNNSADLIYVKHDSKVYEVRCPKEIVTVIRTPTCFANGIVPIIDGDGEHAFLDTNNFITSYATPVNCHQGPLRNILLSKVEDQRILLQGSEHVSFALMKDNQFFDVTSLLNENSTEYLILLEEKVLAQDKSGSSFITYIMVMYRRHAAKIHLTLLISRFGLEIILVIAGLALGLPLIKSLSLASSSIKKIVDFKSYIHQHRLYQLDVVAKFHRKKLGQNPELSLSQLTSHHLECVYNALENLQKRCEDMELIINQLSNAHVSAASSSPTPTPSSTPPSSPTSRRARGSETKGIQLSKSSAKYRAK